MQKNRFTLVEILTVSAMICLVMAVILIAYNGIYRSWATKNTIATMKAAQLPLDKFKLENEMYPVNSGNTLGSAVHGEAVLKKELHQACSPFSQMNGNTLLVFDDFGDKKAPQEIYYVAPVENRNTFMLMSKGKDGEWGGEDDIVFLPHGLESKNLKPGFYMCNATGSGTVSGEIEPIAQ